MVEWTINHDTWVAQFCIVSVSRQWQCILSSAAAYFFFMHKLYMPVKVINIIKVTSTPFHSVLSWSISILSHLCLRVPSGLFTSNYPIKMLYAFSSSHVAYVSHPSRALWFDHHNIGQRVQNLLPVQDSDPFGSKHSPDLTCS